MELLTCGTECRSSGAVALGDMTPGGAVDLAVGLASAVPASWGLLGLRRGLLCGRRERRQELAAVVATGTSPIACAGSGMPVDDAGRRISLQLAVDTDIFGSMAKLRAAPAPLGARAGCLGVSQPVPASRPSLASRMLTCRDSWTNLLRTTTATSLAYAAARGR
ncbi:MAG: methylmalonyl-CoA mutase family protein [Geminicoccaceae bacterium]